MNFLIDMGLSPQTAQFLRAIGYKALHLYEVQLHTLPDPEILAKARREGYIVLTHDLDFGELMAASGANLPSVVTFRLRNMQPHNVNRHLQAVIAQQAAPLQAGAVITVTEGRVRIRQLPINSSG